MMNKIMCSFSGHDEIYVFERYEVIYRKRYRVVGEVGYMFCVRCENRGLQVKNGVFLSDPVLEFQNSICNYNYN